MLNTAVMSLAWIRFEDPWAFLLLLGIPLLAWLTGRVHSRPALVFAPLQRLSKEIHMPRGGARQWGLDVLRYLILTVCIAGLARPQLPYGALPDHAKGVDIMLTLDFSNSMNVRDYTWEGQSVSRLEALIEVIKMFIEDREDDRFGIVGFAKFAYLASPLTLDKNWVKQILEDVNTGTGTAVGDGIMLSVDYLQENPDREKTIILVSDGLSNRGTAPLDAARYAAEQGIRIYTVRIIPGLLRPDRYQQNVLYRIAHETGGQFYQATDSVSLMSIYDEINKLETSRVEQNRFQLYHELFPWFLGLSGALLALELALRQFVFRRIP
jgi:Ca-activated chloride channel homolog